MSELVNELQDGPTMSVTHLLRGRCTMPKLAGAVSVLYPTSAGRGWVELAEHPRPGTPVLALPVTGKRRLTLPRELRLLAGLANDIDLFVLVRTDFGQVEVTLMTGDYIAGLERWPRRIWPQ